MVEFSVLSEVRRGVNRTTLLEFWKADLDMSRRLVDGFLWEVVLKVKRVQEDWTFLKRQIFKEQEQAVHVYSASL